MDLLLTSIRARATAHDLAGDWPADDLAELAAAGAYRWSIPKEFGGDDLDPLILHERYESVARASLPDALIISQRDSAIRHIAVSHSPLRQEFLPPISRGEIFVTLGVAQLTTSRQGGPPALLATPTATGFRLTGIIPWATSAPHADLILGGAALQDGPQILFLLPRDLPGIQINPPLPLVALRSSCTSTIELQNVQLPTRWLLNGPGPNVLSPGKSPLPIGQAFLAFGLCRGALDLIAEHNSDRARSLHTRFTSQLEFLRARVLEICKTPSPESVPILRAACNELAVRITQAAVALYKGSALLSSHPAQRLAREAMFLLVWSCPDPVIDCTVNAFADQ